MTFCRLVLGRILRLFQSLAGFFKRAVCFMRKRDNIGELPYTVVVQRPGGDQAPAVDPAGWGNDFQWSEKQIVEDKIDEWRRSKVGSNADPDEPDEPVDVAPSVEQSTEPDFFNDMAPEIKKPKKAILRPKLQHDLSSNQRNLFGFQGDVIPAPVASAELGELDDNGGAWEDDISSTLQEHRILKQKARHDEYERRMMTRRGEHS